jgi:hypothetical protein
MNSVFFRKYIDILSEDEVSSDNDAQASSIVNNLSLLLRNLIGRADSKNLSQEITYHTLNSYLNNVGGRSINFDELTTIYDQYPEIASLIKDFDKNKITLYTKEESPDEKPVSSDQEDNSEIKRMAKSTLKTRGLR